MRNSYSQKDSRAELNELRIAGRRLRIVLGRAFHETIGFADDCISRCSDSLFRDFPAHLKLVSRGEARLKV
jgi:hypothetical protein